MDDAKNDRRRYVRMDSLIDGTFSAGPGTDGLVMVHNVSRSGFRVSTNRAVSVGASISLDLWLPGSVAPVSGLGTVVWSKSTDEGWSYGHCAGVQVVEMDRYERARVLDHAYEYWRNARAAKPRSGSSAVAAH